MGTEEVDVLIVGAGLSGIGAAVRVNTQSRRTLKAPTSPGLPHRRRDKSPKQTVPWKSPDEPGGKTLSAVDALAVALCHRLRAFSSCGFEVGPISPRLEAAIEAFRPIWSDDQNLQP